jgi:hypothetical protein
VPTGRPSAPVGFFRPIEERVRIKQKVLKYTPVQKVEMLSMALLAGAKAVYQTSTLVRVDRALQVAFGLPGCADQSVIGDAGCGGAAPGRGNTLSGVQPGSAPRLHHDGVHPGRGPVAPAGWCH